MSTVEARLKAHGHEIPPAPAAVGNYVPALRTGNLVLTSGQIPTVGKEVMFQGKVGHDLTEEQGMHAARLCALNALAQIKAVIGSLDRVVRVVRVEGFVQSAPGFSRQPAVINGASDLIAEAFGEFGKHTRMAIGVSELPLNSAVELSVWAEVA
jgi:enamine deaminase RidA (YjgF/YER057c/UK114 family)